MNYLIALPFILASSLLYSLGGSDYVGTSVRKYGVPVVCAIAGYFSNGLVALAALALVWPLSMGYGESSWLRKLLKGSNFLTRLVVGSIISAILCVAALSLWPLLLIIWYLLWTTVLKIDDREIGGLLIEELLIGASIGICILL